MPPLTFHLFFVIMQFNNRQVMDEQERLEKVIAKCEEFYCDRLTELVDRKMIDEAGAIFEEFVVVELFVVELLVVNPLKLELDWLLNEL